MGCALFMLITAAELSCFLGVDMRESPVMKRNNKKQINTTAWCGSRLLQHGAISSDGMQSTTSIAILQGIEGIRLHGMSGRSRAPLINLCPHPSSNRKLFLRLDTQVHPQILVARPETQLAHSSLHFHSFHKVQCQH
jgi:hypothetical protein